MSFYNISIDSSQYHVLTNEHYCWLVFSKWSVTTCITIVRHINNVHVEIVKCHKLHLIPRWHFKRTRLSFFEEGHRVVLMFVSLEQLVIHSYHCLAQRRYSIFFLTWINGQMMASINFIECLACVRYCAKLCTWTISLNSSPNSTLPLLFSIC